MALDPLTAGLDVVNKVLDKFFPNADDRAKAAFQLAQLQQSGELAEITAQTDINKVEAANTNWFVAGWRPCVGWICAIGLGYATLIEPFMRFIAVVFFSYSGTFPQIDLSITNTLLTGMLGLGSIRMYEKVKGVERN